MAESTDSRVAVYLDFDNIIISRRDQASREHLDPAVDIDAILDFASSFGTLTSSKAYADWSRKENFEYREKLLRRAVDTIQMFTTSGKVKNAADIRLAIDVVEDLYLLHDISHIVIVAGDSDYIPLAQRAKRLGRYVVGIGVAGSTSRLLAAACDEFHDYDKLPGLYSTDDEDDEDIAPAAASSIEDDAEIGADVKDSTSHKRSRTKHLSDASASNGGNVVVSRSRATQLLLRAIEYGVAKSNTDWQSASDVKRQMLRMEPGFQESALGFGNFTAFLASRQNLVEIDDSNNHVTLRLRNAN